MFVLPPILTGLWNFLSLRFPLLRCCNQLLVRDLSLMKSDVKCFIHLSCRCFFWHCSSRSRFIIRCCGDVADMIADPVVILPPDGRVFLPTVCFTGMYILGDLGLFSIIFSANSCPRYRCHCERDIVLSIGSSFLGGTAMEVCRFFLSVAHRLAR